MRHLIVGLLSSISCCVSHSKNMQHSKWNSLKKSLKPVNKEFADPGEAAWGAEAHWRGQAHDRISAKRRKIWKITKNSTVTHSTETVYHELQETNNYAKATIWELFVSNAIAQRSIIWQWPQTTSLWAMENRPQDDESFFTLFRETQRCLCL